MPDTDPPGEREASSHAPIRTFLIADVRGYTLFTQERGDEAAAKLAAKLADIAREVVEARGGTLLELRGDEALCVFASTREAIRAAVDLQQRFVEETLEHTELPLAVGIGLDAGEAVPVEGGYRGAALNLAARLCGQARAGEILATREVTHLARRVEGARYEDRGSLSFKGISDPVVVVRVVPEGVDPVERLRPYAPAPPPPSKTSRRWVVVGAIVAVLALVAISIPLLSSGDDDAMDIGTNSVARMNAEDGRLEGATELGQRPGASAIGFGSLWVAQPDRASLARLDLETGSIVDTIPVGTSPAGVAVGMGSVWVTNGGDGTVSRIDAETNTVSQTIPSIGTGPSGIAVGDGALWIADTIGAQLLKVDPVLEKVEPVALAGEPSGVAVTPNGVWVTVAPAGIARVDPTDPSVTLTQSVGSGPTAVIPAFGSIWVANHLDNTVSRLEPSTGRLQATISVGDGPNALGTAVDSLWVANELDGSISAIDPAIDSVEQTIPVGGSLPSLVADGDRLWLAVGASASEHRGGTLTVSSEKEMLSTLDPAGFAEGLAAWEILSITNDGLLAYRKVGGPNGATLVPDLASALPQVSSDGLTQRFPLRKGIRYSTGELVHPEDFRHAIERTLSLTPDLAYLFESIEGATDCSEDPATCDLSGSIEVDAEAVTFHLERPDPDLGFKLALPVAFPVPVATPMEDQGFEPIPATGPYMIAEAGADGIELVRNPEFREWSAAAQPDGFVDAISWRFDEGLGEAFDRLRAGGLDWMSNAPRPQDLASLQAAHPDQVVLSPIAATAPLVGFDLGNRPFNDVRVRQALNYAIDRDHVVELLGGPTTRRPTCQMLPPNFQGYEPFCPYTLEPASGVWSAPDRDRAQALIEDADAAGEKVTVWMTDSTIDFPPGAVQVMRHVTHVLNDLGLRAELRIVHDNDKYFSAIYMRGTPQIYLTGWGANYPGAGGFIDDDLRCGAPGTAVALCTKSIDVEIQEAQQLQATDPAAANRAWTEIEHQLVQEAVWAPLTNPLSAYAFSARVENIQVHPEWGILLSRLWVQ